MPSLDEQLNYMYSLQRFGIKPGLDTISRLLGALSNPERRFRSIHITGTNGKGSTSAIVASILQAAGWRVGLYTSPHLLAFNERIQINNRPILDPELAELIQVVRQAAEKHQLQPTFFEFTTAVAYIYFARQSLDMAVIEVGLGGGWDATNVITPELSIVTNIGLDHADIIGPTVMDIAKEKAGIIKPGVPLITAEKDPGLLTYFQQICADNNSELFDVNQLLSAELLRDDWQGQAIRVHGSVKGRFHLPLLGEHQITNMLTAALAANQVLAGHSQLNAALEQGIGNVKWPGRLQVLSQRPFVLIDGAHNEPGLAALNTFLNQHMPSGDVVVLGIKQGKDTVPTLQPIISRFQHVITTEGEYQPIEAKELANNLKEFHSSVQAIPDASQAMQTAQNLLPPEGRLLVTGSLYLLPAALNHFH